MVEENYQLFPANHNPGKSSPATLGLVRVPTSFHVLKLCRDGLPALSTKGSISRPGYGREIDCNWYTWVLRQD